MKTKAIARHGDVFIFKVEDEMSTDGFKEAKNSILAYGEVTGHSHKLEVENLGDLMVDPTADSAAAQDLKFELKAEGTLTHQEHEVIKLKPGKYIAVIQEEYDPVEYTRKVLD